MKVLNPKFVLGIPAASEDGNPRGLHHRLISDGWYGFYEAEIEPRVLLSDAQTVMIRVPGGVQESGPDLEFDMMTQCRANPITKNVGSTEELAWVLGELRKLGRRTALYLGSTKKWDGLPAQRVIYLTQSEIIDYVGLLDEIYVDGACNATEADAYPIVHRVCREMGIECGAELRGLYGKYSHANNHPHVCSGERWDATGGVSGDSVHAAITPFTNRLTILSENHDPQAINAKRYAREASRVCVGFDGIHSITPVVGDPE
jgi:hypothetical protein